MDSLDLYKRSLQHKKEAYRTVLQVASELETFTSIADWGDWLENNNARSDNGTWATVLVDGISVELHLPTMTLMANKGGGDSATVRYLLDYTQHEKATQAAEAYSRRK